MQGQVAMLRQEVTSHAYAKAAKIAGGNAMRVLKETWAL